MVEIDFVGIEKKWQTLREVAGCRLQVADNVALLVCAGGEL